MEYLQKMMTAREGCDRRSAYTLMGCIAKLGRLLRLLLVCSSAASLLLLVLLLGGARGKGAAADRKESRYPQ
jgi:hypothetical protein